MTKSKLFTALAAGALALAVPMAVSAHFILAEPKSWIVESALGDPQTAGPCGVSTGPHTLTNVVTPMRGGDMVHIKVTETIYHPGFYRVALSVLNRSELPADPEDTVRKDARGRDISVSGKIESAPKPPVLADGLFLHHTSARNQVFETDIKLPNINCDKCTLQIIQFMEEHGVNPEGKFTYHHCADLKITANPQMPVDKAWPGQG